MVRVSPDTRIKILIDSRAVSWVALFMFEHTECSSVRRLSGTAALQISLMAVTVSTVKQTNNLKNRKLFI